MRRLVVVGLVLVCVAGVVGAYMSLSTVIICRESATRIKACANLRQIGQAARQYEIDHGEYPDSFQTLVLPRTDLSIDTFVSPLTTDTPAPSWTAMFSQPGHISYVWVGSGLTGTSTPDNVLGYQRFTAWRFGTTVLYSNGSVRYLSGTELQETMRSVAKRVGTPLPGAPPWSTDPARE